EEEVVGVTSSRGVAEFGAGVAEFTRIREFCSLAPPNSGDFGYARTFHRSPARSLMRALSLNAVGAIACGAFLVAGHAAAAEKVGFRQLTCTHPVAVQRGTKAEVRLRSNLTLDETHAVLFARPGIKMT